MMKSGADRAAALPPPRECPLAELMHHLVPTSDRSGDRLRKEADIERVAFKRISPSAATLEIDQIHDMVEGEKADAERQRQGQMRYRSTENVSQIVDEEIGVFVYAERSEVQDDSQQNDCAFLGGSIGLGRDPIAEDRDDHHRKEVNVPVAVENER